MKIFNMYFLKLKSDLKGGQINFLKTNFKRKILQFLRDVNLFEILILKTELRIKRHASAECHLCFSQIMLTVQWNTWSNII